MIHTVTWAPDAEEEIRIWISSGSRNAVKKATDGIDKLLRVNPEAKGNRLAAIGVCMCHNCLLSTRYFLMIALCRSFK